MNDYFIKKYEINEWHSCYQDVGYFIENYYYKPHPILGNTLMKLYPYQHKILNLYTNHSRVIGLLSRQVGITSISVGYLVWKTIFRQPQTILLVSHNQASANDILDRLASAYYMLPDFMKTSRLIRANKSTLEFDNDVQVIATSIASQRIKGLSVSTVYFDNFSFGNSKSTLDFYTGLIPALTVTKSQIIINSTPNLSTDFFAKIWNNADPLSPNYNGYTPFIVNWDEVPDRDESFKSRMQQQIGPLNFKREYECQFVDKI